MFSTEELEKLGEATWLSLTGFSEVNYVTRGDENPYKPFYRVATILVHVEPPHFKVLGLRRHLTHEEALEVTRATHPYLRGQLVTAEGQAHFLRLFEDFAEMYDPAEWA